MGDGLAYQTWGVTTCDVKRWQTRPQLDIKIDNKTDIVIKTDEIEMVTIDRWGQPGGTVQVNIVTRSKILYGFEGPEAEVEKIYNQVLSGLS